MGSLKLNLIQLLLGLMHLAIRNDELMAGIALTMITPRFLFLIKKTAQRFKTFSFFDDDVECLMA